MNHLIRVLAVESVKVRYSRMFWISVVTAFVFPLLIGLVMTKTGDVHTGVKVEHNPRAYMENYRMVVGIGGLIGFGFIVSWLFGREHAEGTITNLLALPIARSTVVTAKFVIASAWCWALAVIHFIAASGFTMAVFGNRLSWPAITESGAPYGLITAMVLTLSFPVAWVAGVSRGYIGPLGFGIGTIVVAQLAVVAGMGAMFPWAIPALISGESVEGAQSLGVVSYGLPFGVGLFGIGATWIHWCYKDQT